MLWKRDGIDAKKKPLISGVTDWYFKCYKNILFNFVCELDSCWRSQLACSRFWSWVLKGRVWCCYLSRKLICSFAWLWRRFEKPEVLFIFIFSAEKSFILILTILIIELPLQTLQAVLNQVACYWLITGIMTIFSIIVQHQLRISTTM